MPLQTRHARDCYALRPTILAIAALAEPPPVTTPDAPGPPSLAEVAGSRENVFDALRLLAAVLVLFSHSFALTRGADPVTWLNGETLGTTGVSIFFGISGFLVTQSWQRSPRLGVYTRKRGLRLMPALIVVVLLSALLLGPLASSLSVGDYFGDRETYLYVVRNVCFYTVSGHLPGVFEHNLVPRAVNGSLWTLPIEVTAYVGVAVAGLTGLLTRRPWVVLVAFVILALAMSPVVPTTELGHDNGTSQTLDSGELLTGIRLLGIFAGGACLWLYRERITLRWDALGLMVVVFLAFSRTSLVPFLAVLLFPYLVLVLAYRLPRAINAVTRPGDVSYGMYLFAFPVQQALVAAIGTSLSPGGLFALALPVTYGLALASWRLIERPALAHKTRRIA